MGPQGPGFNLMSPVSQLHDLSHGMSQHWAWVASSPASKPHLSGRHFLGITHCSHKAPSTGPARGHSFPDTDFIKGPPLILIVPRSDIACLPPRSHCDTRWYFSRNKLNVLSLKG